MLFIKLLDFAPLAQLVEQLTLNQLKRVLSEIDLTNKNPPFKMGLFLFMPYVYYLKTLQWPILVIYKSHELIITVKYLQAVQPKT